MDWDAGPHPRQPPVEETFPSQLVPPQSILHGKEKG